MDRFNANTIEKAFSDKIDSLISDKSVNLTVAFSGGADSLALLLLCTKKFPLKQIFPLYVNHKIRKDIELDSEIELNRENCKKLGLELNVETLDRNELEQISKQYGTEAAARTLRYRRLEEFSDKNNCSYILTAHHKDDQLETVFMRVKKNSPVTSLRGISEIKGRIVRPLLDFRKAVLEKYLIQNNFLWSLDSTNKENGYLRNKTRNILLPDYLEKNKDGEAELLRIREDALKQCEGFEFYEKTIDIQYFLSLNKAKQYIVLYSMWDSTVGGLISVKMLDRVIEAVGKKTSYETIESGGFCICGNRIFAISKKDDIEYAQFNEKLHPDMKFLDFECKCSNDPTNKKAIHLNTDKLCGEPYVRFVQTGDRITLNGGSKTVIKVLQDMKIPRALRIRTPVITDDNGIVAVFGSVWGGKDRLAQRFRTDNYTDFPCITFACLNK